MQIDVDKAADDKDNATIAIRGTKKAIAEAKAAILAIAEQVAEETTATVDVPSRFHRTIIGAGGQGLKDLIARCGGPTDSKAQAGLIRLCVSFTCMSGKPSANATLAAPVKASPPTRCGSVVSRSSSQSLRRNWRRSLRTSRTASFSVSTCRWLSIVRSSDAVASTSTTCRTVPAHRSSSPARVRTARLVNRRMRQIWLAWTPPTLSKFLVLVLLVKRPSRSSRYVVVLFAA